MIFIKAFKTSFETLILFSSVEPICIVTRAITGASIYSPPLRSNLGLGKTVIGECYCDNVLVATMQTKCYSNGVIRSVNCPTCPVNNHEPCHSKIPNLGICLDCESNESGLCLECTAEGCPSCYIVDIRGYLKIKCILPSGVEFYKCWFSNTTYQVPVAGCEGQAFSALCDNDPAHYQLCGFITCSHNNEDRHGYCGNYVCGTQYGSGISDPSPTNMARTCNGYSECHNGADEVGCEEEEMFTCTYTGHKLPISVQCDGIKHCAYYGDELNCNHTYGVECKESSDNDRGWTWREPSVICNGVQNCPLEGEDEYNCTGDPISWCIASLDGQRINLVNERQLCGEDVAEFGRCSDNRDQLNCSGSTADCKVENYTTHLSPKNVCDGSVACDDGIDEICLEVEQDCYIHKHKLCDGNRDCLRGKDEQQEICQGLIKETCDRVIGGVNKSIPLDWLCDGQIDCKDGKDEDKNHWKLCGKNDRSRCVPKDRSCSELFRCPSSPSFVKSEKLCDNVESCAGENGMCRAAQSKVPPLTTVPKHEGVKRISFCLPGLEDLFDCTTEVFKKLDNVSELLVKPLLVQYPVNTTFKCSFLFGEQYVYASCSNRCQEKRAVCPLTVLNSSSCGSMRRKVMVPSLTNKLTVIVTDKGGFSNNIFSCANGNCIGYSQVCDLADNCGDGSDEENCINHFKCKSSESERKYLRHEAKCDGQIHCSDLSDECNEQCGERIINDLYLRIFAWIVGSVACLINLLVVMKNIKDLFTAKTKIRLINSTFILLIAQGDLLIGAYLLTIAVVDTLYSTEYCPDQMKWLVSVSCSIMGVISTVGSQLSLFSMTCLSLYRGYSMRNLMGCRTLTKTCATLTLLTGSAVILSSVAIAVIPELKVFENYFINGLHYPDSPLFIGAPTKSKHLETVAEYYGRFSSRDVPWDIIRVMVKDMFTTDNATVKGISQGFYGNDGVCLFKYFVDENDPQKIFSLTILIVNMICFIIITASYIFINRVTAASGAASASNRQTKNSRTMQRKITIIILTDFLCWVPFLIFSLLHFSGAINATKYYGFFSIVVLPINSVVNPLLYGRSVSDVLRSAYSRHFSTINRPNPSMVTSQVSTINRPNPSMVTSHDTFKTNVSSQDQVPEDRKGHELTDVTKDKISLNSLTPAIAKSFASSSIIKNPLAEHSL